MVNLSRFNFSMDSSIDNLIIIAPIVETETAFNALRETIFKALILVKD